MSEIVSVVIQNFSTYCCIQLTQLERRQSSECMVILECIRILKIWFVNFMRHKRNSIVALFIKLLYILGDNKIRYFSGVALARIIVTIRHVKVDYMNYFISNILQFFLSVPRRLFGLPLYKRVFISFKIIFGRPIF